MDLDRPKLFYLTDKFIKLCDLSKRRGEICPFLPRDKCEEREDFRIPFFEVFNLNKKKGEQNEKRKK